MQSENENQVVEAQAEEMPYVEPPVVEATQEVVRDFNINDTVLMFPYDHSALIVGKAQYLNKETMYLVEYQANQQGQKTAWISGKNLH